MIYFRVVPLDETPIKFDKLVSGVGTSVVHVNAPFLTIVFLSFLALTIVTIVVFALRDFVLYISVSRHGASVCDVLADTTQADTTQLSKPPAKKDAEEDTELPLTFYKKI